MLALVLVAIVVVCSGVPWCEAAVMTAVAVALVEVGYITHRVRETWYGKQRRKNVRSLSHTRLHSVTLGYTPSLARVAADGWHWRQHSARRSMAVSCRAVPSLLALD